MSNLTISFASLVKYNNGFFKSEKQANFLLSKCLDNVFYGESTQTYKNITRNEYRCDAQGVVSISKYSQTKKTLTVTWERQEKSEFNIQLEKTLLLNKTNKKLNVLNARCAELVSVKRVLSDRIVKLVMKGMKAEELENTKVLRLLNKVNNRIEVLANRIEALQ